MTIWQADLHRPPLISSAGEPLWEFLVCNGDFSFSYGAQCPQREVNKDWVVAQLQTAIAKSGITPEQLQIFRPQALSLLTLAADTLGVAVVPTRYTPTLHQWLAQRAKWYPELDTYSGSAYDPLHIDQPPPLPLSENLWGDRWGFATLAAGDFERTFPYEPIPISSLPVDWLPSRWGLASTTPLPGVIIDAGRQAIALAQWLQSVAPAGLRYAAGEPDGLILEAGLCDRWVMTTFADGDMAQAGRLFEQRKTQSQGLHFLLVRPDDSGMTYTGLWLLR